MENDKLGNFTQCLRERFLPEMPHKSPSIPRHNSPLTKSTECRSLRRAARTQPEIMRALQEERCSTPTSLKSFPLNLPAYLFGRGVYAQMLTLNKPESGAECTPKNEPPNGHDVRPSRHHGIILLSFVPLRTRQLLLPDTKPRRERNNTM